MQIPVLLHGTRREVERRCRTALTHHKRGGAWWDALEADGMRDTAEHPGLLLIGERFSTVSGQPHYRCYAPWDVLAAYYQQPPRTDLDLVGPQASALFAAGLQRVWALVGLLGTDTVHTWLRPQHPERDLAFLRAVVAAWEALVAEGARYSGGRNRGDYVWEPLSMATAILIRHGLPAEALRTGPLPGRDLRAYLVELAGRSDVVLSAALQRLIHALPGIPSLPIPAHAPALDESDTAAAQVMPVMSPAMIAAMQREDAATVQRLIEGGENPMACEPDDFFTPMDWAVRRGHGELVRTLLDHGADIEDRFDEGESPLMVAAYEGHRALVDLLLERGADPTYRSDQGWDAVGFATLGKQAEIAAMLEQAQRAHPGLSEDDERDDEEL